VRVAVIHGPNLNLLGRREPEIYGRQTLEHINADLSSLASELGIEVEFCQANGEGELIDYIQTAASRVGGFVINAGGYTHTSVALLDALVAVGRPYVETHLSNLAAREAFRQPSLLAGRAGGVVMGFGAQSYSLALRGLAEILGRDADEASQTRGRP
jgi:3-dehydroquinate dehydratase II